MLKHIYWLDKFNLYIKIYSTCHMIYAFFFCFFAWLWILTWLSKKMYRVFKTIVKPIKPVKIYHIIQILLSLEILLRVSKIIVFGFCIFSRLSRIETSVTSDCFTTIKSKRGTCKNYSNFFFFFYIINYNINCIIISLQFLANIRLSIIHMTLLL